MMSEETLSQKVTIQSATGLHLRPAGMIAERAGRFEAKIEVIHGSERVDARSVLNLITLGAQQGTELLIEATGPDAAEAITALVELVESGFTDENKTNDQQEADSP